MISKISFVDYQKINALNISSLVNIKKSPEAFKWHLDNREETKSLTIGRLLHTLILEPETVLDVYSVAPDKNSCLYVTADDLKPLLDKYSVKKGKTKGETINALCPFLTKEERSQIFDLVYDAFLIESQGKEVVSFNDYHEAVKISSKVIADKRISNMLKTNGKPEMSIEQEINGVKCKGRIDFLGENFFLDYKSTNDCSPEAFVKDFVKYQYHTKLAFYQKLIELETGKKLPCVVIVQSKEENNDYSIFEVSQDFLDIGEREFVAMLETYKTCTEKNDWPPMNKEIQVLEKPVWLK